MQVLNTPKILLLGISNISYEKLCGSGYVEMFLLLRSFNFQVHMSRQHKKGLSFFELHYYFFFLISNQKT